MSMSNNDPAALNQAAAHDTGLYDPTMHDNQIVAMYETNAQARSARDILLGHGVAESAIQLVSKDAETGTLGGVNAEDADSGMWGAIKSLFAPDEDRTAYTHAVGRGHAMLIVNPGTSTDRTAIIRALEGTDPIDFDAKLEEWRQAGYDTTTPYAATGSGSTTMAHATTATTAPAATAVAATGVAAAGSSDTLKVIEERLRVGKREVDTGAVRIRSYVVERPVEEQVRLREERVSIERRPVDRAVTVGDMAAFEERVIEARATSEEAVVGKEARVVEEIGLHKDVSERVETVKDTVRETKVEVEGDVKGGTAATTGAQTSGANAPRR